jgi:small subunit ribosomal protein S6
MSETRVYETTILIKPDLEQVDYEQVIQKFNQLLKDNGATLTHQEVWGNQKLAYEIVGKNSAYYVLTEFQNGNDELIGKLEQEYIYDERVIRFLTVRLDKYAILFNDKRKLKAKNVVKV